MRQVIKITLFFAAAMIITQASMAQEGLQLSVGHNAATPLGSSFRGYVNKPSFRGLQESMLFGINNHLRVGLQSSYNDFYQKYERQVYKSTDGSDVSTVLSNSLQTVPVFAKGEYSFFNKGFLRPYVGLGTGINFVNYDQFLGGFEYDKHYTKAAFTGDAGLLVPLSRKNNSGFRFSTSYNLMPFNKEGVKNLDSWNVQTGFTVPLK
ncbi:MAG: porin family protein [Ferruginibacter sp.]|nr:porin family protein [Ferruginibacter sp.]